MTPLSAPPNAPTSLPDENDFPFPLQMTARTSGRPRQRGQHVEQLGVHGVVERIVFVRIVIRDGRDRAIEFELHRTCHAGLPRFLSDPPLRRTLADPEDSLCPPDDEDAIPPTALPRRALRQNRYDIQS